MPGEIKELIKVTNTSIAITFFCNLNLAQDKESAS